MIRAEVKPELLRWARERAGMAIGDLLAKFPKLESWERTEESPTLKQLESFARATRVPIGFLFLSRPPEEAIPIPDYRTVANKRVRRPSPDLLETIYLCQQRQAWYREFARTAGGQALGFVGSIRIGTPPEEAAADLRRALGIDLDARAAMPTWTDALRRFIEQADELGVLVMSSGVVLNNNRRKLDPEEFRGFALVDDLAPLVFINGADTKSAQMFTLAHELAHLWLGQSALSDAGAAAIPSHQTEGWCNRVAVELLVPLEVLRLELGNKRLPVKELLDQLVPRLTRRFKVSSLVILRRLHDAGRLRRSELNAAYEAELKRLRELPRSAGGDFYLTQAARASKRFVRALVVSTVEGNTLYRDALRMLGMTKVTTFHELGRSLDVL